MFSHSVLICSLLCLSSHYVSAFALVQPRAQPYINESKPEDHAQTLRQGWTSSPNERGTIDIVWSCVFTMGLCSWSMLCLNLPAPQESRGRVMYRRAWLTALGLLGPEFIFQLAFGQYLSARQSVNDFRAAGFEDWTLTHAFFADAGGFVLHPKDWVAFPLDAKQLHYLVVNRYIQYPAISRRMIQDKNKVDGLLRLLTFLQITFFVFNVSARAAQGLAITCGELTTAAFIICSLGTALCWAAKPADVLDAKVIDNTDVSIATILLEAGDSSAARPYSRTPLDFISRREWAWSLFWANWLNILRRMRIPWINFVPKQRPIQRFEDSRCAEIPESKIWTVMTICLAYSAVFVSGWNYSFPTITEQLLWRIASLSILATVFAYWLVTYFAFSFWPAHRPPRSKWLPKPPACGEKIAAKLRNNSVSRDPQLTVPLKALLPVYVLGFIYCHARTYIFLEDILELRSLPKSAYVTVDWAQFVPHLW